MLGAIGVVIALPRRGVNPHLIGLLIGILAVGLAAIGLVVPALVRAGETDGPAGLPSPFFYVFALIALASAARVISHPRPVYAALYFILTILSSASLFIITGAEFMGFALIIIYAGAILITYLFVIMLATQAPTEEQEEALSPYDAQAREPVLSVVLGFTLIAVLTGSMVSGVSEPGFEARNTKADQALLFQMPKKVLSVYERLGVFPALDRPELDEVSDRLVVTLPDDAKLSGAITFGVSDAERWRELVANRSQIAALVMPPVTMGDEVVDGNAGLRDVETAEGVVQGVTLLLPPGLEVENAEAVGFALIADHPIALELAGVILLMAMLGAVVLARKQIEIGEAEKEAAAGMAAVDDDGHSGGPNGQADPETGSKVARGRHVMVTGEPA
ncbi:MAG: NADH-quinone oxidoreductase subunit J [Planctomycetota bacterium]